MKEIPKNPISRLSHISDINLQSYIMFIISYMVCKFVFVY